MRALTETIGEITLAWDCANNRTEFSWHEFACFIFHIVFFPITFLMYFFKLDWKSKEQKKEVLK